MKILRKILWIIMWFLVLLIIAWPLGFFCGFWYVCLSPIAAWIEIMRPLTDLMMDGTILPFQVARKMKKGRWKKLFVYVVARTPLRNSLKDIDGCEDLENTCLFDD